MKITEVSIQVFTYRSNVVQDSEGHGHPGPEREATGSLLRIGTDSGAEGFIFGVDPTSIRESVAPLLLGEDLLAIVTEYWQLYLGPFLVLVVLTTRRGIYGLIVGHHDRDGRDRHSGQGDSRD